MSYAPDAFPTLFHSSPSAPWKGQEKAKAARSEEHTIMQMVRRLEGEPIACIHLGSIDGHIMN
ncbi:MAG: hypothetical protein AAFN70_10325, partial [Planctomycetota bacterium]